MRIRSRSDLGRSVLSVLTVVPFLVGCQGNGGFSVAHKAGTVGMGGMGTLTSSPGSVPSKVPFCGSDDSQGVEIFLHDHASSEMGFEYANGGNLETHWVINSTGEWGEWALSQADFGNPASVDSTDLVALNNVDGASLANQPAPAITDAFNLTSNVIGAVVGEYTGSQPSGLDPQTLNNMYARHKGWMDYGIQNYGDVDKDGNLAVPLEAPWQKSRWVGWQPLGSQQTAGVQTINRVVFNAPVVVDASGQAQMVNAVDDNFPYTQPHYGQYKLCLFQKSSAAGGGVCKVPHSQFTEGASTVAYQIIVHNPNYLANADADIAGCLGVAPPTPTSTSTSTATATSTGTMTGTDTSIQPPTDTSTQTQTQPPTDTSTKTATDTSTKTIQPPPPTNTSTSTSTKTFAY